jgi:hypothetical protein
MGFHARERIFVGDGPELLEAAAVFAVDDMTDEECRTLATSVQQCLNELHESSGSGPWTFELGPSASENAAKFVNLKSDWNLNRPSIDEFRSSSRNSWRAEIAWLYDIAYEHAEIIRGLRAAQTPVVYLQCDDGGSDYETFDCIDDLTWDEIETLKRVLTEELSDMGMYFRIVSDWHAEREPATFVKARLSWNRFEEDMGYDDVSERVLAAGKASEDVAQEIRELRKKPVVFGPPEEPDETDSDGSDEPTSDERIDQSPLHVSPNTASATVETSAPREANESLRADYRDPDNYWRNVWLYEQRKAGLTNAKILSALTARSPEFAPLETENALRYAIDSISSYHGWPSIKGRAGRPRVGADETA